MLESRRTVSENDWNSAQIIQIYTNSLICCKYLASKRLQLKIAGNLCKYCERFQRTRSQIPRKVRMLVPNCHTSGKKMGIQDPLAKKTCPLSVYFSQKKMLQKRCQLMTIPSLVSLVGHSRRWNTWRADMCLGDFTDFWQGMIRYALLWRYGDTPWFPILFPTQIGCPVSVACMCDFIGINISYPSIAAKLGGQFQRMPSHTEAFTLNCFDT